MMMLLFIKMSLVAFIYQFPQKFFQVFFLLDVVILTQGMKLWDYLKDKQFEDKYEPK